jgi:molybdate transport system substrate-binding protein
VAGAWRAAGHAAPRIAYGASSALARQVDAGAPAELFLSADLDWIDWLAKRHRLAAPPVRLLANDLVLIAPAAGRADVRLVPGVDLARALDGGRLAIADPRAVPAGRYARAALESLGAWKGIEPRLAPAGDVRAALALVARGEAPLGIVYRTDALAEPRVRVVATFPEASHPPIVYGLALLDGATADARAFAEFAASPPARAAWARHGFRFP